MDLLNHENPKYVPLTAARSEEIRGRSSGGTDLFFAEGAVQIP